MHSASAVTDYDCTSLRMLDDIFRVRKQVFVDRLAWKVQELAGRERDRFDRPGTRYLRIVREGELQCTCRLIGTDRPNMLHDVFPALLRGEAARRSRAVVEISRLGAIGRSLPGEDALSRVLDRLARHAAEQAIVEYVFVTTVSVERMLRRHGARVSRFGDGRSTDLDGVRSVALRMPSEGIPTREPAELPGNFLPCPVVTIGTVAMASPE